MKPEDMLMLNILRNASEAMSLIKMREFPVGEVVHVDTSKSKHSRTGYHGIGIVAYSDGCTYDEVVVLLENGNIWNYPIECCSLANHLMKKELPTWIRKRIRERNQLIIRERKEEEANETSPF